MPVRPCTPTFHADPNARSQREFTREQRHNLRQRAKVFELQELARRNLQQHGVPQRGTIGSVTPEIIRQNRQSVNAPSAEQTEAMRRIYTEHTRFLSEQSTIPRNARRNLESWLAATFGRYYRGAIGRELSLPGEIANTLNRVRANAEGMVTTAAKLDSISTLRELDRVVDRIRRNHPNLRRNDLDIILIDSFEVGNDANVHIRPGNHNEGWNIAVRSRYNGYMNMLQNEFGLSREEISQLQQAVQGTRAGFDRVRITARSLGVDVGDVEGINYFARIFTDEMRMRFPDLDIDTLMEDYVPGNPSNPRISSRHNRSRVTNHWLPNDIDHLTELLELPRDQVEGFIQNPGIFREYLQRNLSPDDIDLLVDSGVVTNFPMTARDLQDYFVSRYDLPFPHLRQMMITDPRRALAEYGRSLQQAAANSSMIQFLMNPRANLSGWSVPRSIVSSDPDQYRNFVPLSNTLERWSRESPDMLREMGIDSSQITRNARETYVHPLVAEQFNAIMRVSTDPAMSSNLSGVLQHAARFFNRSILLGNPLTYIMNSTGGMVIGALTAGSNMINIPVAMNDIARLLHNGLDAFDDTRPVFNLNGEDLTYRQAMRLFINNYGSGLIPGLPGERLVESGQGFLEGLQSVVNYTMATGRQTSQDLTAIDRVNRLVRASFQGTNRNMSRLFSQLGRTANFLDNAGRWSVFISTANRIDGFSSQGLGQLMTSASLNRFYNADDVFNHIDSHIVNHYNIGTGTSALTRWVLPFSSWWIPNMMNTMRNMYLRPRWYLTYARLHAILQDPLAEDPDFNQATVPDWVFQNNPIFLQRDGEGRPMILLPGNFDPVVSTWNTIGDAARMVNLSPRSDAQLREEDRGESVQRTIERFVGSTYYGNIIETITNRDFFTGAPNDQGDTTFLGVQMPSRMRFALEQFPVVGLVDSGVRAVTGGRPRVVDQNGEIIDPGELDIFGRMPEETRNRARQQHYLRQAGWFWRILEASGANIRVLDYEDHSQLTYADIRYTAQAIETQLNREDIDIRRLREELNAGLPVDEIDLGNRTQEFNELLERWIYLRIDQARVERWMLENDVLPSHVLRELERQEIRIRTLPVGQDQMNEILNEAIQYGVE